MSLWVRDNIYHGGLHCLSILLTASYAMVSWGFSHATEGGYSYYHIPENSMLQLSSPTTMLHLKTIQPLTAQQAQIKTGQMSMGGV